VHGWLAYTPLPQSKTKAYIAFRHQLIARATGCIDTNVNLNLGISKHSKLSLQSITRRCFIMKQFKIIPVLTLLTSLVFVSTTSPSLADERVTLKPGNGMSFIVGTKRATTYFHPRAGECEVTLMLGEATVPDGQEYLSSSRLKIRLTPHNITRIDSFEGKSLSIVCNKAAETITVIDKRLKLSSLN